MNGTLTKIIGLGLIIAPMFYWTKSKVTEISDNLISSAKQLRYEIKKISNIDWIGGLTKPKIRFDLDLEIINPTFTNFVVQEQNVIKVSRIEFLDNNNGVIAVSYPLLNSIDLPAQSSTRIENIEVELPLSNLGSLLQQIQSLDPNNVNIRLSLLIAGKEYTIK